LESEKDLTGKKMELNKESLTYIANESGGDARVALNLLEIIFRIVNKSKKNNQAIKEIVREVIQKRGLYYNKKGDYHYDTISAFIKSLRGSEPDAGLYYLVRMLISGEDPKFIARRMIIFASEDIGNSNPEALIIATSAFNALEFVGMPEARICLAQAVIYLATSVKSNSTVKAVNKAWQDVENEYHSEIPAHLRNKPVNKGEKEYQYPHNFENHYVRQDYLPTGKEAKYYFPTEQGNEMMIKKYLNSLKKNKKQKK
ncbi:MAG: replication-associated recombination protein A, partial [Actinomycetia bacterium]|nr:replication-associated recombination protein A [Actinomycetes bacterium]